MKQSLAGIRTVLGLILGLVMTFCLFALSGRAASLACLSSGPANPTVHPASNGHTVPTDTVVSITYDGAISPTHVSTQTFAVYPMQTGFLTQTYGVYSGTIVLTATQPFHPGEMVQVSATTGTLGLDGQEPISPTVWQFRTGVSDIGSGQFTGTFQSMGSGGIALGDLDGDGDLDAFATYAWLAPNKVYLNTGTGTFIDSLQSLGGASSQDVALGDLDGDGDLDAFVANSNQADKLWLNDGNAQFPASQSFAGGSSYGVALGDMDGDGDLDVLVAISDGSKLWLNDGTGVFSDSNQSLTPGASAVALGDLNGDGDLDVFFGYCDSADHVWFNDGTGTLTNSGQGLSIYCTTDVALGDLDGDGDLDAFVVNDSKQDSVWMNGGTGFFAATGQAISSKYSKGVDLGDLDGDGDLDAFVVASKSGPSDRGGPWMNDGAGEFVSNDQDLSAGGMGGNVALGDVDGDGDLDALVVEDMSDAIWLNINQYRTFLPYVSRWY